MSDAAPPQAAHTREIDIVIFGATGYTGRWCLNYLKKQQQRSLAGLRVAVAGRSDAKLRAALADEGLDPRAVPVVVADAGDAASLEAMCRRAFLVVTLCGPFVLYGRPLVEAAVRCGTHVLDMTGEFTFVRALSEEFDEAARAKGVFLLSMVGFDCVPASLLSLYLHRSAARAASAVEVASVHAACEFVNVAGFSGGTLHTTAVTLQTLRLRDLSPFSLLSKALREAPDIAPHLNPPGGFPMKFFVTPSWLFGGWAAPGLLSESNQKATRATHALLGFDSSYGEVVKDSSLLLAVAHFLLLWVLVPILSLPLVGDWLRRAFLPAPGEGPTREAAAKSGFRFLAAGFNRAGARSVSAVMRSTLDVYIFSAASILEAAAALVRGEFTAEAVAARARPSGWGRGGVVTPAALLGDALLRRLEAAGCEFRHTFASTPWDQI